MNTDFITAVLSNPAKKGHVSKVRVRPLMKGGMLFLSVGGAERHPGFSQEFERRRDL